MNKILRARPRKDVFLKTRSNYYIWWNLWMGSLPSITKGRVRWASGCVKSIETSSGEMTPWSLPEPAPEVPAEGSPAPNSEITIESLYRRELLQLFNDDCTITPAGMGAGGGKLEALEAYNDAASTCIDIGTIPRIPSSVPTPLYAIDGGIRPIR